MVVDDLDAFRTGGCPAEAYAELVVHANRVLPASVAFERLQSVTRRRSKIVEFESGVEHGELPFDDALDVAGVAMVWPDVPVASPPSKRTASTSLGRRTVIG